jgi:hypothetical protein
MVKKTKKKATPGKFKPGMASGNKKNGSNQFSLIRHDRKKIQQQTPSLDGIIAKTKPKTSYCCAENVSYIIL